VAVDLQWHCQWIGRGSGSGFAIAVDWMLQWQLIVGCSDIGLAVAVGLHGAVDLQ
jgi:hypothetical protein